MLRINLFNRYYYLNSKGITKQIIKAKRFKQLDGAKGFKEDLGIKDRYIYKLVSIVKISIELNNKKDIKSCNIQANKTAQNIKLNSLNEIDDSNKVIYNLGITEIPQDIMHIEKQAAKIADYMQNRYSVNTVVSAKYDYANKRYLFESGGHRFSIEIDRYTEKVK